MHPEEREVTEREVTEYSMAVADAFRIEICKDDGSFPHPMEFRDTSLLPYPKNVIRHGAYAIIIEALVKGESDVALWWGDSGLAALRQYQDGVGSEPVGLDLGDGISARDLTAEDLERDPQLSAQIRDQLTRTAASFEAAAPFQAKARREAEEDAAQLDEIFESVRRAKEKRQDLAQDLSQGKSAKSGCLVLLMAPICGIALVVLERGSSIWT